MGEFRMPSLGADMDVGTIVEWMVGPGDTVSRGQIVAVVDTAKAAIEIEAFEDGVIDEILIGTGVRVPVGTPLALIATGAPSAGAEAPRAAHNRATPPASPAPTGAKPGPVAPGPVAPARVAPEAPPRAAPPRVTAPSPQDRAAAAQIAPVHSAAAPGASAGAARPAPPRASPPVRHLAHQLGIDLDEVTGTGPDGRITHDDLLNATPSSRETSANQREPRGADALAEAEAGRPSPARRRRGSGAAVPGVGRLRATPRARRMAAERGIDLGSVPGSGSLGAVLGADVEQAAAESPESTTSAVSRASGDQAPPPPNVAKPTSTDAARAAPPDAAEPAEPDRAAPADDVPPRPAATPTAPGAEAEAAPPDAAEPAEPDRARSEALDRKAAMRTAIANLMSRSNQEIPHYYVSHTMDLAASLAWLDAHNADLPAARRVLPAALFLRATVLAALAVPDLNGHWVQGSLQRADRVDLGVAVATRGGGLVTPALPDVGQARIDELMSGLLDLVSRARRGNLRQSQMAGASITVSSLGEAGPDALFGVIFPPQVALVGIGGIVQRPWAVGGMLAVRPTVTITLAADHRATDGRTASAFIAAFDRALQNPEDL